MNEHPTITFIESSEYSVMVNISSSYTTARNVVLRELQVEKFIKQCHGDPHLVNRVMDRIDILRAAPVDPNFESPHDVALFTYLVILQHVHRPSCRSASFKIARTPNLWWAQRLAISEVNR